MATEFIVQGRIVWGHPGKSRVKKDVRTKQPVIREGKQVEQWTFGVAVPKAEFGQVAWPAMLHETASAFPNGAPSNFAYKFKDGDTNDSKGQPYSKREGYAGHCVINFSTEAFAPPLYKQENGQYRQLDPSEIKCGDYVAVKVSCKYNGAVSPNTPGLYMNPVGIIFLGYGQEIVSSEDPEEMFAGHTFTLPQGASATPLMSGAPLPGGMAPGAAPAPAGYPPQGQQFQAHHGGAPAQQPYQPPAQGYQQPPAAGPAYGAPQPGAQLPPPAHDFVQNATGAPGMHPQPGYPPQPQQPAAMPGYGGAPAQGFTPPGAVPATMPQPGATAPGGFGAGGATSYPSNGAPAGYPPQR